MTIKTRIQVQTSVVKEIEVEIPSYYSDYSIHYKITRDGVLTIGKAHIVLNDLDSPFNGVDKVIKYGKSTEAEFTNAFNRAMSTINLLVNNASVYNPELEEQEG